MAGSCPDCGNTLSTAYEDGFCLNCGWNDVKEVSYEGQPKHYTKDNIECVDYLWDNMPFEAFVGGVEWNIKKYLHRWRDKGEPVKDLRKARDYLSVLIDVMEGKEPQFKEWK